MTANPSSTNTSSFNDDYWRDNYSSCSYVPEGSQYEDYQEAYQIGHEGFDRYANQSFEEAESKLKHDYESLCNQHGRDGLPWSQAKDAVRDTWDQAATT